MGQRIPEILLLSVTKEGFLVAQLVKNLPAMQETHIQPLGWEDPLKKAMAAHFKNGILAWRVAWTEEPGMLQSMGSQRVRNSLATKQQQQCSYKMAEINKV